MTVSGAEDTPEPSRQILQTLTNRLGAKSFHVPATVNAEQAGLAGELTGPLTLCSYEITDEPVPDAAFDRLPTEVQKPFQDGDAG
jgi:hypothetical protein